MLESIQIIDKDLYAPMSLSSIWNGRADALPSEYMYQQIRLLDLSQQNRPTQNGSGYALLGFQCDEGISRNLGRTGAAGGPMAFRQSFAKLAVHHDIILYDAGNIICPSNDLETAQGVLKNAVADILSLGLHPVIIGGGHETAFGHYQGLHQYFDHLPVAIINFDAHFDLRPLLNGRFGSSGTPFFQIDQLLQLNHLDFYYYCIGIQPFSNTKSLFDYAHQRKVEYLLAEDIRKNISDFSLIEKIIEQHERIYLSLCLDVFQANIAPGVSAPQPLGISTSYVVDALHLLKKSNKVVSIDVVELSPTYDIDCQTAKLASSLIMEYLQ